MEFSEADKGKFTDFWENLLKKYKFLNLEFYREFPTFFFNERGLYHKYQCFAGSFFIQIDPFGNVHTCNEYKMKVGNVREEPINKIWNSQRMRDARKMMKNKEYKCMCWYNCNGTPNCYLTKIFPSKH
jgi:MoaA/NifB/PqqE/SkfB family radical SAM enzyme